MIINSFKCINFTEIKKKDITGRNIGCSVLNDCILNGRNNFYPNVLILMQKLNILCNPYDEQIMSLNKSSFYDNNIYEINVDVRFKKIYKNPIYFFIYNFDNYYHYLYDTIPYLYTYLELKKNIHDLKILVNYPNKDKKCFYEFNMDILTKIININDIIIHDNEYIYDTIYIGNSLTHGGFSNNPPRPEIYSIFNNLPISSKQTPPYIYISRRTWINNDLTNIGTNYTTRRKMINEDILVEKLAELGFVEIFTENLSINEKINLFKNAKYIVGSIGGGVSNLIFSDKSVRSIIIVSPFFLEINYRFKYSLEKSNCHYFYGVHTYKMNDMVPLYSRIKVKSTEKIGEIVDYSEKEYVINISENDIAGFNNEKIFNKITLNINEFDIIDSGLNSPYIVEINDLINFIKEDDKNRDINII